MTEEINEGDWISYPEGEGQVIGVDEDGYGVRQTSENWCSRLSPRLSQRSREDTR